MKHAALSADAQVDTKGRVLRIHGESCVVQFSVRFLGLLRVRGKLTGGSGTVVVAERGDRCAIDVRIPVSSLMTGIRMRDRHLRGERYFNVARYPDIAFNGIGGRSGDGSWLVTGISSVTDRSIPLGMVAELLPSGARREVEGEVGNADRFKATAVVRRQALGLRGTSLLIPRLLLDDLVLGSSVHLDVSLELVE